jgi:hypothetical protein
VALVTKSKKDKMVIMKVYPHVCATSWRYGLFSEDNVEYLKANSDRQVYYLIPMKWGKEFSTNN